MFPAPVHYWLPVRQLHRETTDITWLLNSPSSSSISLIGTYWPYVTCSVLQLIIQSFIHAVFSSLRMVITHLILLQLCWRLDVSCNMMWKNISCAGKRLYYSRLNKDSSPKHFRFFIPFHSLKVVWIKTKNGFRSTFQIAAGTPDVRHMNGMVPSWTF